MLIQHSNNSKGGSFFIKEGDEPLAEMTYNWQDDRVFVIDHTEVSEKLAGKGIGKQLVHAAVEFARENGYKIVPVCSFAKKVLEKEKDFADVLHQSS